MMSAEGIPRTRMYAGCNFIYGVASASAWPPFGSAQGLELAETAPHETGEAFQTFVRREDTPALP
jgi:hypothetical protein